MKRFIQALAVVCAFTAEAVAAQVQPPPSRYCSTTGDVSLSAAATTFTVQQSAGSPRAIYLESALVTTSVAGSFTQSVNGTAATSTAGTVTQIPGGQAALTSIARSWTASNVGAGTAIAGKITTFAGGPGLTIDLSEVVLKNTGTASNYSITIGSMTGTANITVCWREQ
jgi:hypothetical protein